MTFDPIEYELQDVVERMRSRLLMQFQKSLVLTNILDAFGIEVDELLVANKEVVVERSPLQAIGVQLDGLGRIAGQPRILIDYAIIPYFTSDDALMSVDRTGAWVENAPTSERGLVDDSIYRLLIEAKIFRNFTKYGSVSENQKFIELAFNTPVSFILIGPMTVLIIVPETVSLFILNFLTSFDDTMSVDRASSMPYPPTLKISGIFFIPEIPFTPDTDRTVDVAKVAVQWNS